MGKMVWKGRNQHTVPKVDGKFRYIERVALVQSNMERIFLFTYFPSRECEFPVTNGISTPQSKYSILCN
jgi:hypothetical protein